MPFNLLRVFFLALSIGFTYYVTSAQHSGKAEVHLKSRQVTINSFEWTINNATGIAQATISITNNSKQEIKSITALFTGQDKKNIMLQSNGVRTIRRKSMPATILPGETKTVTIEKAFKNPQLETLKLMQMNIEYTNGSIEMIN